MSQGRGYRGNLCTSLSILLASKTALKNRALVSVKSEKVTQLCPTLCEPMDYEVHAILHCMGSLPFLPGIFPTQGTNPGLPHCRRILYQLSHQGNVF